MTTIVAERSETGLSTGYNGFLELCRLVEFPIEPFQKRIARLVLEADREALILLPRGNSKTSLQALVALHHLLTIEDAEVFCCASSRDQARILFQYAARFAPRDRPPQHRPPPPRTSLVSGS